MICSSTSEFIFKLMCAGLPSALSMAPLAMAQSATGAVAGRASAGDQIMITNRATGATRVVTVGADGSYRLSQLPVGEYDLQLNRGGQAVGVEDGDLPLDQSGFMQPPHPAQAGRRRADGCRATD